ESPAIDYLEILDLRLVTNDLGIGMLQAVLLVFREDRGLADHGWGAGFEQNGVFGEKIGESLGVVRQSCVNVLLMKLLDCSPVGVLNCGTEGVTSDRNPNCEGRCGGEHHDCKAQNPSRHGF